MSFVSRTGCWVMLLSAWCCATTATDYHNHVLFDNSNTPDSYY